MSAITIRYFQEARSLKLLSGRLRLLAMIMDLRKSSRRRSKDLPLRYLESRADIRLTATIGMVADPID